MQIIPCITSKLIFFIIEDVLLDDCIIPNLCYTFIYKYWYVSTQQLNNMLKLSHNIDDKLKIFVIM